MNSFWSKFEENSEKLFVHFTHKRLPDDKDEIACWLTDLKVLFSETLIGMSEVMERVISENPLLLTSGIEKKVLETILVLPKKSVAAKVDQITFSRANNRLQLKYYLSEKVPLKFYWTLGKCDETKMFEMVTVPLLRRIVQAEEKCRDMVDIIKRKDLEIEQYKLDGAQLTRSHFATALFDASQMKSQAQPLFDCSVGDLLLTNTVDAIDDGPLNVSSSSRESETSKTSKTDKVEDIPAKSFVPNRHRARKIKRTRYDAVPFSGPTKPIYKSSDDDNDDVERITSVSSSTVQSHCSGSNDNATENPADSNSSALSTKPQIRKIRNVLNI